jgi:hypothetical protein
MKAVTLTKLKAKITRLHNTDKKRIFLDNHEFDVVEGGPVHVPHNTHNKTSSHAYDT